MYIHECCKHCNNNPSVNPFASGICHCVLPYMEMNDPLPKVSDYQGYTTSSFTYIQNDKTD